MIPYFPEPLFVFAGRTVRPMPVLILLGVLLACGIVLRRASRAGLSVEDAFRLCFAGAIGSMAGAVLIRNPAHWGTLSGWTYGGFLGAFAGGVLYARLAGWSIEDTLRRLDLAALAAPPATLLARIGCTLAHHHRGVPASNWFSFEFPGGPRYDLAFLEVLFLVAQTAIFWRLAAAERKPGFFLALFPISYGAFRILLDFLRMADEERFFPGALMMLAGAAVAGLRAGRAANGGDDTALVDSLTASEE